MTTNKKRSTSKNPQADKAQGEEEGISMDGTRWDQHESKQADDQTVGSTFVNEFEDSETPDEDENKKQSKEQNK